MCHRTNLNIAYFVVDPACHLVHGTIDLGRNNGPRSSQGWTLCVSSRVLGSARIGIRDVTEGSQRIGISLYDPSKSVK